VWAFGCARRAPAVGAFAVLWPAAYLLSNFVGLDYVSAKYFVPFSAFTAFALGALVWLARRWAAPASATVALGLASAALVVWFAVALRKQIDPWYYARADFIAHEHTQVLAFTPMLFAASGREPGCGLWNPGDTFGGFGEAVFGGSERTRRFEFPEERLVDCLRANPSMPVVIDFWYYFFTRPGSPLRTYLRGDGAARAVFFSRQAAAQWDEPYITIGAVAR
jgi:hypothetical protein